MIQKAMVWLYRERPWVKSRNRRLQPLVNDPRAVKSSLYWGSDQIIALLQINYLRNSTAKLRRAISNRVKNNKSYKPANALTGSNA